MEIETLFSWAPKSLQLVIAAMKLQDACSLEESYDQPREHIKKQRDYFADKVLSSQSYGFSSSCVWMGELVYKAECWRIDAFQLWLGEGSWESLGLQDQTSQS